MKLRMLLCVVILVLNVAVYLPALEDACTRCGPALGVSPSSLTFPAQVVHTRSAAMTITLSSSGTVPVQINKIVSSGAPFSQSHDCGKLLPKGAQCSINVTFKPKAVGTFEGTITIDSNAGQKIVDLTGVGVPK